MITEGAQKRESLTHRFPQLPGKRPLWLLRLHVRIPPLLIRWQATPFPFTVPLTLCSVLQTMIQVSSWTIPDHLYISGNH